MITALLSTRDIQSDGKLLIRNYFIIVCILSIVANLTSIFVALYLIDLFGFLTAGVLFSTLSLTQFIFDFPTGVLSDLIGQKGLTVIGMTLAGIGYILFGIVTTLDMFFVTIIIIGVGNGLLSGIVQTWYENNYQFVMKMDTERKIYGIVMARIRSLSYLVSGLALIVGSYLAFTYSRQLAFQVTGIVCIIGGIAMISLLKNFIFTESAPKIISVSSRVDNYFSLLKESFSALYHDHLLLTTLVGIIIISGALGSVFLRFILIPMFYNYTLNDALVGAVRSSLLFFLAIDVFIISFFVSKFQKHYFPLFYVIYVVFFIGSLIAILLAFPPNGLLNMTAIILIVIIYIIFDAFISEIGVNLQSRVLIDLIPSKNRNAVWSMFSSASAITGVIFYSAVGYITMIYGLIGGLVFLGIVSLFGCLFLIPVIFSPRIKQPIPS